MSNDVRKDMPEMPAVKLANTFIERFGPNGSIDHLKLQKLCYYAYGWWLALLPNEPRLTNVAPQVWKLGPVFLPIYGAFASFRDQVILNPQRLSPFRAAEYINRSDSNESNIVDWIWGRYGQFKGTKLSDMTHEVGTPWYNIASRHGFVVPRYLEMSDDENRAYFTDLARKEGII